ncbi:MAG: hypothetical protein GF346_12605 [Candidatus Eisenbacteria bacterium]|nr:hypothetical protein [Candidatus Latescibacterota bacterium]MBD3303277.1 hypothetical protein [Candidatus Eisenbacteria bacterium]
MSRNRRSRRRSRWMEAAGAGALGLLLAAAAAAGEGIPYDLDYDGRIDRRVLEAEGTAVLSDRDDDGLLEPRQAPGSPVEDGPARELPPLEFELVWDSGTALNTIWTVAAGDADRDGAFDLAGATFSPNVIHLFEADGVGGYLEVWSSMAATPPGAYRSIVFADTDGDGLGEILGGEVSTLGKVMLFEQDGDDSFGFVHDTIRESDFSGEKRLRSVLVGDTDRDGREEVIVATGGSSPTGGLVGIWEHDGVVGSNVYTRVYEYTTVSYLFQAALGDADNDGSPEIILGLGGFGGYPLIIRRIEFDPAQQTWIHHQFESSVIGLPVAPHVGDFDGDGDNELAYGSSGFVVVYENTGPNSFDPVFTSTEPFAGNLLALADHPLSVSAERGLAAGSFEGELRMWGYDADAATYQAIASLPPVAGAIRGLTLEDDGADGLEEWIPAIAAPTDQVHVYRRREGASVEEEARTEPVAIRAMPNPSTGPVRIAGPDRLGSLRILDAAGRCVRRIETPGAVALWDGRDAAGRAVPSGVYWVRVDRAAPAPALRVIRAR